MILSSSSSIDDQKTPKINNRRKRGVLQGNEPTSNIEKEENNQSIDNESNDSAMDCGSDDSSPLLLHGISSTKENNSPPNTSNKVTVKSIIEELKSSIDNDHQWIDQKSGPNITKGKCST